MTSKAAFKNRVRELMAQQGIPYAEARSQLLGTKGRKSGSESPPRSNTKSAATIDEYARIIGRVLIAKAIQQRELDLKLDDAEQAWVEAREKEGLRIVEGGQTGPYNDDNKAPWEVKDWRTGELLASGVSSHEDMVWAGDWVDFGVNGVLDQVTPEPTTVVLDELRESLPSQLREFISQLELTLDYEDWSISFADWLSETQA